jgi:DNA-binding response OmpR family regulator
VGLPSGAGSRGSATAEPTPVVFVVDDDVSVRESLELLIRAEGWRPETFGSAREFLSHPRVLAAGCLILDVHLPELSGLDLQERVAVERCRPGAALRISPDPTEWIDTKVSWTNGATK